MRQKWVQHALFERFRAGGLTCSWVDCSYILGTVKSGGVNPGFHDSMWKAAAIQQAVGVAFPGDATLVPVDLLVTAVWNNADREKEKIAPYMSLRLKKMLTNVDVGVPKRVGPQEFWAAATEAGFQGIFIKAFVPTDIGTLVKSMHRPFEAPPEIAALFDLTHEEEMKVIKANYDFAAKEFYKLDAFMPRGKGKGKGEGKKSS